MREHPRQGRGRIALFRKVVSSLLLLVTIAAAACAVLAHGGHFSRALDVLAHLAPVYAVMGGFVLLLALVTCFPRRGVIAGMAAIAVLAGSLLMAPEWLRSTGPDLPVTAAGTIKVIQYNAQLSNTDIHRAADWLIAQKPDVVAITETRHDLRDLLIKRAGWKAAGAHSSLMILTSGGYLTMDRPRLSRSSQLTFINATYATRSGRMEVVTTHLDWPMRARARLQEPDLNTVFRHLPKARTLLLGDFNSTPWSQALWRLDRNLGLIRRDRAVATFPAEILGRPWPLPFLPIDHIYAGPGWATVKVERGPWLGSDHYPLIVTLAPVAN